MRVVATDWGFGVCVLIIAVFVDIYDQSFSIFASGVNVKLIFYI